MNQSSSSLKSTISLLREDLQNITFALIDYSTADFYQDDLSFHEAFYRGLGRDHLAKSMLPLQAYCVLLGQPVCSDFNDSRKIAVSTRDSRAVDASKLSEMLAHTAQRGDRFLIAAQRCSPNDLLRFSRSLAHIAHSAHSLLSLQPPTALRASSLFAESGLHLSQEGLRLLRSLRRLYEEGIPQLLQQAAASPESPACSAYLFFAAQRLLKSVHTLMLVTQAAFESLGAGAAPSGQCCWQAAFDESAALLADILKVYDVSAFLSAAVLQDGMHSDLLDYFKAAAAERSSGLLMRSNSNRPLRQPPVTAPPPAALRSTPTPLADPSEALQQVAAVFPDFSPDFIKACLQVFDLSAERTVDALLSDNLPPQLAGLDRALQTGRISQKGGARSIRQEKKETNDFAKLQKQRVSLEEKQRERETQIAQRLEYEDDYDDQYGSGRGPEEWRDDEAATAAERKPASKKEKPVINWEVRMREMKMYNNLLLSEEREERFWESMRNTNRDVAAGVGDEESEEAEQAGAAEAVQAAAQPARSVVEVKATGDAAAVQAKKKRNKTFDKHHQKDRALRKMA